MTYDPERTFHELEKAAEERAQAEYDALLLERQGEILLAQKMFEAKAEGVAVTLCKEWARTQAEWKIHIEGEAAAVSRRSRARARYENLKALAEARRTQEASTRALTR